MKRLGRQLASAIPFALFAYLSTAVSAQENAMVAPGLAVALQATLTHHPAAKGKRAELEAQGYAIGSARAGRLPTLSFQANNLDDEINRSSVRLQQPLWTFGKISAAIKESKAEFIAQQWELLKVQRKLLEDTAAAYAKIQGLTRRSQVAGDSIAQHQQLFQSIERRQRGALASEADVQLANSRLIQARVQREGIAGELQLSLAELRALTQIPVAADIPVDPSLAQLPESQVVEALAMENSAEVHFKQERVKVAELAVQKERTASRPNIYFQVDHDFNDSQINVDETRVGLNFVGSYDGLGFRSRGQVKSAIARAEAAKFDFDATVNEVKRRVGTLMLNRRLQQDLIASQTSVVESLTATVASFLRQYESGRKSWVEVLNAQRELTEQRLLLAQIENEWLILSLRVAALTGALDQYAGLDQFAGTEAL